MVCLEISKAFIDVPAFNKHLPEQMELLSKAVSKHLTVFLTILDLRVDHARSLSRCER